MSFPTIIFGSFGDEKVAQSARIGNLPLGTPMDLPDGRRFRLAKMSATAGVVGLIYTGIAGVADHGSVAGSALTCPTAVSVGDKSIVVTLGGTSAVTKDQYADGYITTVAGTGAGNVYRIRDHLAGATTTNVTINFADNENIAATIAAGTTTASLMHNEYFQIVLRPTGSTQVAPYAGVLPVAASANFYCWVQRRGPAAMLVSATAIVIAQPVTAATGEAGMVTNMVASTTNTINDLDVIGICRSVSASAGYAVIDLNLE